MLTVPQINYLNILLMIVSAGVAMVIPFELFLFSYAVLGPLHYLTEISWLQKKGFYVKGKYDYIILLVLGLLVTIAFLYPKNQSIAGQNYVFAAFVVGIALIFLQTWYLKLFVAAMAVLVGFMIQDNYFYIMFFAIFLPTLIHVYIFTGLFVIHGALRSKSVSGYLSMIVFILCTLSCFWVGVGGENAISLKMQEIYDSFISMSRGVITLFGIDGHTQDMADFNNMETNYLFFGEKPVMLMRFIAFAYTYHYLNWFSKTSIIKWHEVSALRLMIIATLWIFSVFLYFMNYTIGLKVLYFLSMVHVFLEFPLNIRSFTGIGEEIRNRFVSKKISA
ncbi:MAG: hypothetical protein SGJ10_06875 [Bacteroidota bacterium]|nr:hypothetical protein [Bacteroidota bacterium]